MLERRFDNNVELGSLRVSLWPGIGANGTGLVLHRKDDPAGPPLITIESFSVSTGLMELLRPTPHIRSVRSEGLDGAPHIEVGEIDTNDAVLRILPRVPGKEPLLFNIHQLIVRTVARQSAYVICDHAAQYQTTRRDSFNRQLGVFEGISGIHADVRPDNRRSRSIAASLRDGTTVSDSKPEVSGRGPRRSN